MTRHYLHADQNNVKNAVALLPNVTGITTQQEEKEAAQARMEAAVKVLEGLTVDQLKKLVEKAGAEIKKLEEKAKKKSGDDKSAAKKGEKAGAEVSAVVERIAAWADIIGWSVLPLAAYLDCSIICAGIGSAAKALLTLAMAVKFVVLSILLLAYRAPWYMVPLALLAEGIAWFIPGSLIYLLNPYSNLIHYLSNRSNRG